MSSFGPCSRHRGLSIVMTLFYLLPNLRHHNAPRSPTEPVTQEEALFYQKKVSENKKVNDYFLLRFTHSITPNPAQTEVSTVKKETGEYVVFFTGVTGVTGISLGRDMFVVT